MAFPCGYQLIKSIHNDLIIGGMNYKKLGHRMSGLVNNSPLLRLHLLLVYGGGVRCLW